MHEISDPKFRARNFDAESGLPIEADVVNTRSLPAPTTQKGRRGLSKSTMRPLLSSFTKLIRTHHRQIACTKHHMHTAQVSEWGQPPKYVNVPDLEPLPAGSGLVRIKVQAAGLHSVVRARAAGTHFSSKSLPHVPGTDGVGITVDGRSVYFTTFATGGSFSEVVDVPEAAVTLLPSGVDPQQAAALVNPGLSSWMAMKARTQNLPNNFSVFIMGATSASGAIAISLARSLGAAKVIGCARNVEAMSTLGLDETIQLQSTISETEFSKAADVDLILDYLYGPPTEHLFKSLKVSKPLQYVHIGSLAGPEISLPGSILRSTDLTIRGSGPGAFSYGRLNAEVPRLLEAFKGIKSSALKIVSLSEVEKTWSEKGDRTIFVP